MKQNKKYNPRQSITFQIEDVRNKTRAVLSEEYMIFLINLYGHLIQDGTKTIKDFKKMTMLDVRSELVLRTKAMRGDTNAKIRAYKEKEQKKQDELLRKLSRLN